MEKISLNILLAMEIIMGLCFLGLLVAWVIELLKKKL
jgi:hypothetical protein